MRWLATWSGELMRALHLKLMRDMWRLRGQILAISIVLAGGVAMWITGFATIESLTRTRDHFYQDHAFGDVFASLTRAPELVAERIAVIPGVRTVELRGRGPVNLTVPDFSDPVSGTLLSLPRDPGSLNRIHLLRGQLPDIGSGDQVVVSEAFAEAHGLQPGDRLSAIIEGKRLELTITGAAASPEFVYQIRPGEMFPDFARYAIMWMNHEPLAAALDLEDAFNDVVLALERGADGSEVIARLDEVLVDYGGSGAILREDQTSDRFLAEELATLGALIGVVPMIFLGVAVFLLNVVLVRLIQTQRDQIATLKAFGYTNWEVGVHYLQLVMAVVLTGGIIGIPLGAWLGNGMARVYQDFFRFPYLDFTLRPQVAIEGVLFAMIVGAAATAYAVGRAARLAPAQAMGPEQPGEYRRTLLERSRLAGVLDQPTRMILRSLERRPLRLLRMRSPTSSMCSSVQPHARMSPSPTTCRVMHAQLTSWLPSRACSSWSLSGWCRSASVWGIAAIDSGCSVWRMGASCTACCAITRRRCHCP
jgi:putative ABC transport system permease protein